MLKKYDEYKIGVKRLYRIGSLVAGFAVVLNNLILTGVGIYATITTFEFFTVNFLGGIALSLSWLIGAVAVFAFCFIYMMFTKNK